VLTAKGSIVQEAVMPTFIVECYWPGITHAQAKHALRSTGRPENTTAARVPARALGCILVPSDGMAIFLFESPSSAELLNAARKTELPFDRIVESIHVGFNEGDQKPTPANRPWRSQ
jgi:hypothetical protein